MSDQVGNCSGCDILVDMEVCESCGNAFERGTFGQYLCDVCGNTDCDDMPEALAKRANAKMDALGIASITPIEDMRGLAEDAIEILKSDRLSAKKKEELAKLLEEIRRIGYDDMPEPSDYSFLEG